MSYGKPENMSPRNSMRPGKWNLWTICFMRWSVLSNLSPLHLHPSPPTSVVRMLIFRPWSILSEQNVWKGSLSTAEKLAKGLLWLKSQHGWVIYFHHTLWDETIYLFQNITSCTGVGKWFHWTLYWTCDYLSMMRLKLIHVSKSDPRSKTYQCFSIYI